MARGGNVNVILLVIWRLTCSKRAFVAESSGLVPVPYHHPVIRSSAPDCALEHVEVAQSDVLRNFDRE